MFVQSTISYWSETGRSWRPSYCNVAVVRREWDGGCEIAGEKRQLAAAADSRVRRRSPEIVYVTAPFSIERQLHLEAITPVALVRPAVHE